MLVDRATKNLKFIPPELDSTTHHGSTQFYAGIFRVRPLSTWNFLIFRGFSHTSFFLVLFNSSSGLVLECPVPHWFIPGPATVGMEIGGHTWVFAYQFFLGSFQFQFWPSPGVLGATPVYPGPGLSLELEKAFGSALTQFFQRPVLSWFNWGSPTTSAGGSSPT